MRRNKLCWELATRHNQNTASGVGKLWPKLAPTADEFINLTTRWKNNTGNPSHIPDDSLRNLRQMV